MIVFTIKESKKFYLTLIHVVWDMKNYTTPLYIRVNRATSVVKARFICLFVIG